MCDPAIQIFNFKNPIGDRWAVAFTKVKEQAALIYRVAHKMGFDCEPILENDGAITLIFTLRSSLLQLSVLLLLDGDILLEINRVEHGIKTQIETVIHADLTQIKFRLLKIIKDANGNIQPT